MGCGASTSKSVETPNDGPTDPRNSLQKQLSKPGKPLDPHHQQFLEAASAGNFGEVKKFAGIVDLNVTDMHGNSALILATKVKSLEIVSFLVEKRNKRMKNADVNHQNDHGHTALHCAAQNNSHDIIKYLLDNNALDDITDRSGKTAMEISGNNETKDVFISFASAKKEEEEKKAAAAEEASKAEENKAAEDEEKDIHDIDEDDYREWLNCAMLGDLAALRSFVDIKKIDVNYNDGWTALLCAAQRDHFAVCEYLLSVGADVNQVNNSECTALHLITTDKLAELLLNNKASLTAENEWGDTPLHDAAWHGRTTIVKMCVEHGADVNARNKAGATPLHHATKYGRDDVVKYLLENKAESSFKDDEGKTPLDYAQTEELKHLFMTIG